jgi:hypothetical protein
MAIMDNEAQEADKIWTPETRKRFGEFMRHNAEHDGRLPMQLDQYGGCITCLRLGFRKCDA